MGTDLPSSTAAMGVVVRRKRECIVIFGVASLSRTRAGDLRAGRQSSRARVGPSTAARDGGGRRRPPYATASAPGEIASNDDPLNRRLRRVDAMDDPEPGGLER